MLAPSPAPPKIKLLDEEAVEAWWADLAPGDQRKVERMVSAKIRCMVSSPWDAGGEIWAYARRFVVSHLVAEEVNLSEVFFEEFDEDPIEPYFEEADY